MKRTILALILSGIICLPVLVHSQQVIVSDDASYTTPASGAMLDVKSTNKGFMPPRIALTSLTDVSTISSPATGLMVYNTGTSALTDKGIYFWNGTIWVKALSGGINGTNYMAIADDGSVTLHGTATTFNDIVINPSIARNNGTNVPLWGLFSTSDIYTWMFEDAKLEEVTFTVQLPHNYMEGSNLYPHIHWAPMTDAGTSRVRWTMDYQWVNLNGVFTGSTTSTVSNYLLYNESSPTQSLANRQCTLTPLGTISGTGKTISSLLVCRVYRDGAGANDNLGDKAALLSIDFHYEIDSFGSHTEFIK